VDYIPDARAPSYTEWNSSLSYIAANGAWEAEAFVRNIGDVAVYTGGLESSFVGGLYAANIDPPRTYGVRIRYDF
jgi:iron complex outermembrane receptor protein